MVTLSVTTARKNLGAWVKKAVAGEDVGILLGDHVVALRPVEVLSKDYAEREYRLTSSEVGTIAQKLHAKAQKARREGRSRPFTGDIEATLQDRD